MNRETLDSKLKLLSQDMGVCEDRVREEYKHWKEVNIERYAALGVELDQNLLRTVSYILLEGSYRKRYNN